MSALKLTVVESISLGNAMHRLVLTGAGLDAERIPADCAGLHIKLFFKKVEQAELVLPKEVAGKIEWPAPELKPIARTYSIVAFNSTTAELVVDFVMHEEPGIACDFARNAKIGDQIGFAGPGPVRLANQDSNHFLLVGDLSSLPAISAVMEQLPNAETKLALIELEDESAIADIRTHYFKTTLSNVQFFPQRFKPEETLLPDIQELPIEPLDDRWSIALAGEHHTVVRLRQHFRDLGIPKHRLYAVPYWRHTLNEETYHSERHDVMDA